MADPLARIASLERRVSRLARQLQLETEKVQQADAQIEALHRQNLALMERIAEQSELLSRRAEKEQ